MNLFGRIVMVAATLAPVALFAAAPAHLLDGLANDAAVPVPTYLIAQIPMPRLAYQKANAVLAGADQRDGAALITRAEAGRDGGMSAAGEIADLIRGLKAQPASARGWVLLAHAYGPADPQMAARCLTLALQLAQHDYWLAGPLAQTSAQLWPMLDEPSRALALAQARMLWEVPELRPQLRSLLTTEQGVRLVASAYARDPDQIRVMNRWLSAERALESIPK